MPPRGGHTGHGAAAIAIAALGLLAVAAGGAAVAARDRSRILTRRRREVAKLDQEFGRRAQLSDEACDEHRRRQPVRLPNLTDTLSIPRAEVPLGLASWDMALVMQFLTVSSSFHLRQLNKGWAAFLSALLRYKPYIKAIVWRGDFSGPNRVRYWVALLDAQDTLVQTGHLYCNLMKLGDEAFNVGDETIDRIRRDIARTMPEIDIFREGPKADSLFRVLRAYAAADPQVGYCQGMNYLAGYLLSFANETMSFGLFNIVLQDYQYRGIFAPGLPHLRVCLFQLDHLLHRYLPVLHRHLTSQAVTGELYASEWIISLFTYTFEVSEVGRIWDVFLLGGWKSLLRVALAILAQAQGELLAMPFESILQVVKQRPCSLLFGDLPQVLALAPSFKVTRTMLSSLEDHFWRNFTA